MKHKKDLDTIMKIHYCDKASDHHHYNEVYEKLFEEFRDQPINIFEVGIFRGESVESWYDYFPNAQIYCVDIFTRDECSEDQYALSLDRVHYLKGNSTDRSLPDRMREAWGEDIKFQFMIDDGEHTIKSNLETYNNLFEFLEVGGEYFIEDCYPWHLMNNKERNNRWCIKYPESYNDEMSDKFINTLSSTGILTQHDLRITSSKIDSFILSVKKTS
jgi:hypothetical protein